jgi:hypothetical protein
MLFLVIAAVSVPGAVAIFGYRRLEAIFRAQVRAAEVANDLARRQFQTMRQLELGLTPARSEDVLVPGHGHYHGHGHCHGSASMLGGVG